MKVFDDGTYPNYKKLSLYKYSHQGFYGDQAAPKPGAVSLLHQQKWDAWESLKGMSKYDA